MRFAVEMDTTSMEKGFVLNSPKESEGKAPEEVPINFFHFFAECNYLNRKSNSIAGGRDDPRARGKTGGGRRTEFGVTVTGLPRTCSWQDLKDFMRKAGDVIYTDVDRDGTGIVEFSCREDMENAVRKLDDTEFKNPFDR